MPKWNIYVAILGLLMLPSLLSVQLTLPANAEELTRAEKNPPFIMRKAIISSVHAPGGNESSPAIYKDIIDNKVIDYKNAVAAHIEGTRYINRNKEAEEIEDYIKQGNLIYVDKTEKVSYESDGQEKSETYYRFKYKDNYVWMKNNNELSVVNKNLYIDYDTLLYKQEYNKNTDEYSLIRLSKIKKGEIPRYYQIGNESTLFDWVELNNGQQGYILKPFNELIKLAEIFKSPNERDEFNKYALALNPKYKPPSWKEELKEIGDLRYAEIAEGALLNSGLFNKMAQILQYETTIWLEKYITTYPYSDEFIKSYFTFNDNQRWDYLHSAYKNIELREIKNGNKIYVLVPLLILLAKDESNIMRKKRETISPKDYTLLGQIYVVLVYKKGLTGHPENILQENNVYTEAQIRNMPLWKKPNL